MNRFTVLYQFTVADEKEKEFMEAWTQMTRLIYQYEGSYGSRLHHAAGNIWIGYAQWPSRQVWSDSGNNLPAEADVWRTQMRNACTDIKTLFEMEQVVDLIHENVHKGSL